MRSTHRQAVQAADRVRHGKRVIRAVVEALDPRMLLAATGWSGGEPATYTTTVYVDSVFTGTENGSQSNPYNTLAEGFTKANIEIAAGRSVKLLVKPGTYRERGLSIDAGQNISDRSQNNNLTIQNTWFRMDRWGATGEVVIDGADDWSVGKGEGGEWTAVAGQTNVYSRNWTRNWGLWGGAAGTANVSEVAGQRREMLWVNYGDGNGWQRLEQIALEQYSYSKPVDDGTPATWNGSGTWAYTGYAGLGALKAGSFGITELSSDAADAATDDGNNDRWQSTTVITANPDAASSDKQIKLSFKQVYDAAANRAPASEANKIFLKLPAGVNINDVQIAVSTREGSAIAFEGKRNVVLANMTIQHFTSRMFDTAASAVRLGRTYFDYYLTSENTLLDNLKIQENNSTGLLITGNSGTTIRNSTFDDNGSTSVYLSYSNNTKVENTIFSDAAWRSATLGNTRSFIPASFKSWKNNSLQMNDVQFLGIVDKGFYSDSLLTNADFYDVTFIGKDGLGSGATHEITPGPISWNRTRFENLDIGLFDIQAQNLSVDSSVFKNNRLAISTVTKTRNDEDTRRWTSTLFPLGRNMYGDERIDLFVDAFSLTNSSLSSNVVGARLISQFDEFSQETPYLQEFITEAVYQNNKYYLTDHLYAFENNNDFSTFSEWIASTGETGASWDSSLTTAAPAPVRPTYAAGFQWKRSTDWGDGERFLTDGKGQDTWFQMMARSRPTNAGRTATTPWYKLDRDYMQFVRVRDGANKRFLKNDVFAHWASATEFVGDYAWSSDYIGKGPSWVEWRNPTGKDLTLRITGDMTLKWGTGFVNNGDVAIVLARSNGTYQELWGGSYAKPAGNSTAIAVSGMNSVSVGAGDRILIGAYATTGGGYLSTLNLADNLTFELVSIAASPAPAAPTSAGTSNVTSSSVTVGWTDNSSDETGFVVQRATDSGFTANVQNFDVAAGTGTGARSYVDSSVAASTTYYYRVKAIKSGASDSAWATASPVTTPASGASLISSGRSATASSLENSSFPASNVTDGSLSTRWASQQGSDNQWIYIDLGGSYNVSQIRLHWETAAGRDYKLQIKASDPDVDTGWTDLQSITNNTTANAWLDYTGLSGTGRYVRMRATARATSWGYSIKEMEVYGTAVAAADTTAPTSVNNTGTSLTQGVTGTVITNTMLKYTDNVSAASAVTYTVTTLPSKGTLKKSGTALALNGTFTQDDLDNSRITYDNTSNSGNDSFAFTVRDAANNAATSATFSITVNKLAAPGSFTLAAGDGKITVSWATVANATGYKIKYGTSSGSYGTTVDVTGGSTTSRDITSLTNGTTYYFVVLAYNAAGDGNATAESSKAPAAAATTSAVFTSSDTRYGVQLSGTTLGITTVGDSGNASPSLEQVANAINGTYAKYLNFGKTNTGLMVSPSFGSTNGSVVTQLRVWTANDAVERDPASYKVYGTNAALSSSGMELSSFTLIAEGDLALPSGRNTSSLSDTNSQLVTFTNSTAYKNYLILFPTVKNATTANSMQIGEVQLYGTAAATPALLDRTGWSSKGNGGSSNTTAFDGSTSTGWWSYTAQTSGNTFIVDMGASKTLTRLVMDSTGHTSDYARGFNVYMSTDGVNWGSSLGSFTGSSSTVDVSFAATTGRYVKIELTSASSYWWWISEFNAYGY